MFKKFLSSITAISIIAACRCDAYASSYGTVNAIGTIATYAASSAYTTPVSSTTDMFYIQGSASKTITIVRIEISYGEGAANTPASEYFLVKRSTANSGGSSTTLTNVPVDSNNAAGTATVLAYTANPTTGTAVGQVSAGIITAAQVGTNSGIYVPHQVIYQATPAEQGIVLRGTAQGLAINFGGTIPYGTSPVLSASIFWTEQ